MIRTPLCDLLDIEHPIIQAGMGTSTSAQLAAAVSNAGALGSIGNLLRPPEDLQRQLDLLRDLTSRPFALNHTVPTLNEESFRISLDARPKVLSFALAHPGDYVQRAHDAGILVMHQVTTVAEAVEAAEAGVDIVVAQGGESGGYSGTISTITLVPQVVDAVRPLPVVAAGGIFDGRGLASALMLGAAGVNVGTRFLASREAPVAVAYKDVIAGAASQDAVRFSAFNRILPEIVAGGYDVALRTIRTAFVEAWEARPADVERERQALLQQVMQANTAGRIQELMVPAGQSAGGISGTTPAADIVADMIRDAEDTLRGTAGWLR
jgi:nitronate monooxygenase/enoyl-[acyl-carrier protein] reductase II